MGDAHPSIVDSVLSVLRSLHLEVQYEGKMTLCTHLHFWSQPSNRWVQVTTTYWNWKSVLKQCTNEPNVYRKGRTLVTNAFMKKQILCKVRHKVAYLQGILVFGWCQSWVNPVCVLICMVATTIFFFNAIFASKQITYKFPSSINNMSSKQVTHWPLFHTVKLCS